MYCNISYSVWQLSVFIVHLRYKSYTKIEIVLNFANKDGEKLVSVGSLGLG